LIRVLVVDDQMLVRAGISQLLSYASDIDVIGEAGDGLEAVSANRRLKPDVVVMDIRMPQMDGLEATRQIIRDHPDVRVLVLTTFELDEYVFEAIRAGASAFLLKDVDPDSLREAVRIVAAGEALLSPSVTKRLIAEFARTPFLDAAPLELLTTREREVLALVAQGFSNAEVGERLFMSTATAKTHVGRTMVKLGVHDRAQLVVIAYQTGLVTPGV
jgi:DNA-binding NarL/FixJ family response regulator